MKFLRVGMENNLQGYDDLIHIDNDVAFERNCK